MKDQMKMRGLPSSSPNQMMIDRHQPQRVLLMSIFYHLDQLQKVTLRHSVADMAINFIKTRKTGVLESAQIVPVSKEKWNVRRMTLVWQLHVLLGNRTLRYLIQVSVLRNLKLYKFLDITLLHIPKNGIPCLRKLSNLEFSSLNSYIVKHEFLKTKES